MAKLRGKVQTVVGSVSVFGTMDAVELIGNAMNNNANVLLELINKVDEIEQELEQTKKELADVKRQAYGPCC